MGDWIDDKIGPSMAQVAGVDVARERQREKTESAAAKSFKQLAADYMAKVFPTLAASTVKQRRQHIEAELSRISSATFISPSERDVWNAA
jgi:hypothetical protein